MSRPVASGIRIAVIDSGVNPSHPHIAEMAGVAGGITIGTTCEQNIHLDFLGHGTAVMAAIQEKAPSARYYAVKIFQRTLRTSVDVLFRAIEWTLDEGMDIINLSLGTANQIHRAAMERLVLRAEAQNSVIVSAFEAGDSPALPGSLNGVISVSADWDIGRNEFRFDDGVFWASPYPRSLPGVPRERNLSGVSFAVANMTGFVAQACETASERSIGAIRDELLRRAISPSHTL